MAAAVVAVSLAAGACGPTTRVSNPGPAATVPATGGSPKTFGGPASTATAGSSSAPAVVPVVATPTTGLVQVRWLRVAGIKGQVVTLDYQYGGCVGPALQATVAQAATTVAVRLWDKGPTRAEVCADFVRRAQVSVTLPAPLAGRSVTDT